MTRCGRCGGAMKETFFRQLGPPLVKDRCEACGDEGLPELARHRRRRARVVAARAARVERKRRRSPEVA